MECTLIKLELITKTKSSEIGTFIKIEGNKITQNKPIVSNEGSSISSNKG